MLFFTQILLKFFPKIVPRPFQHYHSVILNTLKYFLLFIIALGAGGSSLSFRIGQMKANYDFQSPLKEIS